MCRLSESSQLDEPCEPTLTVRCEMTHCDESFFPSIIFIFSCRQYSYIIDSYVISSLFIIFKMLECVSSNNGDVSVLCLGSFR